MHQFVKMCSEIVPEILTSAQMRAIEAAAIGSGVVSGLTLMERAGEGVVAAIRRNWPDATEALVLCGPGNNGGDGHVVARRLAACGWTVATCATRTEGLPPDAATNARRNAAPFGWRADLLLERIRSGTGPLIVVDALLGIGQERDCTALLAPWWEAVDRAAGTGCPREIRCVSIDIPTGYDSDTGARRAARPFAADLVVTFHAEKPVHQMLRNSGVKVVVHDIGLPHGERE